MMCESYNQLTIIEKRELIGKLLHLIQTDENAYLIADNLIQKAHSDGSFDRIKILPRTEPIRTCEDAPTDSSETPKQVFQVINSAEFLASHQGNPVIDLFYKTKDTLQRSYHKIFAKLAS